MRSTALGGMWVRERHLNRRVYHLYISLEGVTGFSLRATQREWDYHLCMSTIIVGTKCNKKSEH